MAAEYRIVAKVDPSGVTQGSQKVKQELRSLDTVATSTKSQIAKAFSGPDLDRAVSSLLTRFDGLEKALVGVQQQTGNVASTNTRLIGSLDQLAAATGRTGSTAAKAEQQTAGLTKSKAQLAAAAQRVLSAIDGEAAQTAKLNALLAEAGSLYRQGAITAEQYARVQQLVASGAKQATVSVAQQRAGYTQLGFQVQDVTQQLALGINPMVILAQQGGQTASALSLAFGSTGAIGKAATFMAGPFGSIILAATAIIGGFAIKALFAGDAAEEMAEKLKKDAAETEATDRAKVIFSRTLDGNTAAIRANQKALDDLSNSGKTAARLALENAINEQANARAIRDTTSARLADQKALLAINVQRASRGGPQAEGVALGLGRQQSVIADLEAQLAAVDVNIGNTQKQIEDALSRRVIERAEEQSTALGKIKEKYEGRNGLIEATRRAASAEEVRNGTLSRQILLLKTKQTAEEDAARAAESAAKASDGVSRFKTRQQAIGIAGRELQSAGLRVDGNEQFGRTSGHGNDADHNKFAIDVNVGKGVTEASVPDAKAKFDRLARSYQARGYNVLWNGQVYPANGSGPSGPIKGSDKHYDHMHIYAPTTIVGKATNAGEGKAETREATVQEQKADFVQGVVDQQATRGLTSEETGPARIAKALADYKRRFNTEPDAGATEVITTAVTEAEARENAKHFDEAYIKPLDRLRALEGLAGQDREIKARQLEEEERLQRKLTDAENAAIVASVKDGETLERKARILEEVRGPLDEYAKQIKALNELLATGKISQGQYNAKIADLGRGARDILSNKTGVDPATGKSYEDIAAKADEDARYIKEQQDLINNREELLKLGIDYDALEEAARKEHLQRLAAIDAARKDQQLGSAQDIAQSLLQITEDTIGKNNALYKGLFIVEKAIAIARAVVAIQTGIALAAANPFPYNLAAIASVAAATASIVSNIASVAVNLADGGPVRGPGGSRSDSVPANLSNGEFVINAAAASRNRALLEAINNGQMVGRSQRVTAVAAGAESRRGRVEVRNYAGAEVTTRENLTTGDVEIMIERGVARLAPKAVSRAMQDPSSDVSKSIGRTTTARRRRE